MGVGKFFDEPFGNTPSKKNIQSDSGVSLLSANWVETETRFAQTETWIALSPLFLSCPHGFSGATGCILSLSTSTRLVFSPGSTHIKIIFLDLGPLKKPCTTHWKLIRCFLTGLMKLTIRRSERGVPKNLPSCWLHMITVHGLIWNIWDIFAICEFHAMQLWDGTPFCFLCGYHGPITLRERIS